MEAALQALVIARGQGFLWVDSASFFMVSHRKVLRQELSPHTSLAPCKKSSCLHRMSERALLATDERSWDFPIKLP